MTARLRQQAALLTAANTVTRGLGFLLRLMFARLMGTEALGVMELANAVGMLALTPVTAGIPMAMSRMTARHDTAWQPSVLRTGMRYVFRLGAVMGVLLLVLSPGAGWLLGDMRTIPALLAFAPAPVLLGLCGVYSGYAMGVGRPGVPALNECVEQTVRFVLCLSLLMLPFPRSVAVTAALPGLAEAMAGVVVVLLFRRAFPLVKDESVSFPALSRELYRLSMPMTLSRLCASGLRSFNAVLLPACLVRSGLSASAATQQFGLLSGMAMPLILLPGVVTGALCTVSAPAVSRLEDHPADLRRLFRRLMLGAAGIGLVSMAALDLSAGLCAGVLFRQPALAPLLRFMCPLSLLMSLRQVQFGFIAGLGLQRRALTGTILGCTITLIVTVLLAQRPDMRIFGAATGSMAGQAAELIWGAVLLLCKQRRQPDRYAYNNMLIDK